MSEKPIKVCFIARTSYCLFNPGASKVPGSTHGGAEVDLYLVSRELAKDPKYEVHFIVGDFGQEETEVIDGVNIHKCFKYTPSIPLKTEGKKSENKNLKIWGRVPNFVIALCKFDFIRSIVSQCSIYLKINRVQNFTKLMDVMKKTDADIFVQEAGSALTGIVCLIAKTFDKKFVYRTAHDMDCNKEIIETNIKNNRIDGYLFEWGLTHADWLITQNEINRQQLLENHDLVSTIIKNAYHVEENKIKKDIDAFWVARGVDWKRPFLFLDLAERLPEFNFLMICPKANENTIDREELEERATNLKNVELIEYVPFGEIDDYFARSKVFVCTSDYEGYPNTFVQSAKNKSPIVSLNVNPDDFLNKYKCGFYCEGDFEELVNKTRKLLSDNGLYTKMSDNAFEYAKKEHDLANIIEQYKEGFESLK